MEPDISNIFPDWKVDELIGRGSYGSVYRISRSELDFTTASALKIVDIPQDAGEEKELVSSGMDEQSIRSYFENTARSIVNEIRIMDELKSCPNVVRIEDYRIIEHQDSIGWSIYIRMELLRSLEDYQIEKKILPREEVIQIGLDLCTALSYCEKKGIIHRDIKPANIFVDPNGTFKLGDFGIARQLSAASKSAHSRKGTEKYMAPEVVRGDRYDNTVDIYSLGILLYRYLNHNRYPFEPGADQILTAEDIERAIAKRLSGEPLPAPDAADEALSRVILRACSYQAKDRYRNAEEMREDLLAVREAEENRQNGDAGTEGYSAVMDDEATKADPLWERDDAPTMKSGFVPGFDGAFAKKSGFSPDYEGAPTMKSGFSPDFRGVGSINRGETAPGWAPVPENGNAPGPDGGRSPKQKNEKTRSGKKIALIVLAALILFIIIVICIRNYIDSHATTAAPAYYGYNYDNNKDASSAASLLALSDSPDESSAQSETGDLSSDAAEIAVSTDSSDAAQAAASGTENADSEFRVVPDSDVILKGTVAQFHVKDAGNIILMDPGNLTIASGDEKIVSVAENSDNQCMTITGVSDGTAAIEAYYDESKIARQDIHVVSVDESYNGKLTPSHPVRIRWFFHPTSRAQFPFPLCCLRINFRRSLLPPSIFHLDCTYI